MKNENKINNAIAVLFENEMTEKGLISLREKYPDDVVHDMSVENEFKSGRKVRTERNELVKKITARRINVANDIKMKGDALIDDVNEIYSNVVDPYEKKLALNKIAKEKAEKELKELLNEQRVKINEINDFVGSCIGKESNHISEVIESVDSIDTSIFHKEIIHEAISTKDNVLERLTELLTQSIAEEALQGERAKLAEEQAITDEKNRLIELKQKAQERLNNLMMIPTTMFGKTSKEINEKITSIEHYPIIETQFGELTEQANSAAKTVCDQLKTMYDQVVLVEDSAAEKIKQEELAKQQQAQTEQPIIQELDVEKTADNIINQMDIGPGSFKVETKPASQRLAETFKGVPNVEKYEPTSVDIQRFMGQIQVPVNTAEKDEIIEALGYLLICDDYQLNCEAMGKLRSKFKDFIKSK